MMNLDDVWVEKAGEEGDFGLELLLEQEAGLLLLVGDADHLDGDGALLVDPAVYPAVGPGRKLVADEELREVGGPLLVLVVGGRLPGLDVLAVQYHRPRLHAVEPPPLQVLRLRPHPPRRRRSPTPSLPQTPPPHGLPPYLPPNKNPAHAFPSTHPHLLAPQTQASVHTIIIMDSYSYT